MWKTFASPAELDRDRFDKEIEKPAARTRYVMHFTPRSGSSWLTDLAMRTKRLSQPGECFNPNFMPRMTRALNARNMDEYIAILERRRNTRNVYGFQITHHQLIKVFGKNAAFAARFPVADWHSFFLIREDIVAQAVSLHKMVQTDISHAPQVSADDITERERAYAYDGAEIKRWLAHILAAEQGSEAFFAETGARPFRMSYERNLAVKPHRVVNTMCRHLGIARLKTPPPDSTHSKVGTGQNTDYAARFRDEYPDVVAETDALRAPTLARLEEYRPPAQRD
ncbi:Stf0 family sulfotransferase [Tateyamaria omphalii]|uniref:Sulphotransferase Stf0 domain-containing protein n=1 Tax=Tateyamaria omphalii TaxID=299262 RepID=A0A1P8N2E7_9RHOB|nr:Stf0 family sulfotransferase [Tateyamaria omphalii]APX14359.1 hypothetical protein BWR18_21205 [Tateyamaria omphalii]